MHNSYDTDMQIQAHIRQLFSEFTSDTSTADIYASLVLHGPQTISELARSASIERTRVYRTLPYLQEMQLVEVELQPHRQIIHAAHISNLQNLVTKKKADLDVLSRRITDIQQQLSAHMQSPHGTKVQFYRGQAGIEQMLWNQTKATTEILSILSENVQSHTKKAFFERWVQRCNENNIIGRSIVDDAFIASQKKWYGGTFSYSLKNWTARKMPARISTIPHRTTVYNNITTYFSWQEDDVFGIEIHNQTIADNQRQYFELMWAKSKDI